MPTLTLSVNQRTLEKAISLCATLGVHTLDDLFDQLIEELEWNVYHVGFVKAALLQRLVGSAAASQPTPNEPTQ